MDQRDLLRHVVSVLERMRVAYLVTGSVATIYYGEPRLTNDIDIVARLPARGAAEFCRAFPPGEFYVSEEAALEAVAQHGQFNIIHPASGLKVDIIIPADSPFDLSRFARVTRVQPAPDFDAAFASVEDVIIKKLEYYRDGGSEKHLRDIAGVLKVSGARVDREYVHEWAVSLGVEPIWDAVLRQAGQ
jgi:hypothetical protein